ncbi:hypothetical protein HNY73_002900 [Argiope bruennichi]|uniref:Uncharacterized protein n=1 Tax=Argiope bruennichi TaxID=94029 RepID=A0A8T0FV61_ARGBR|nr:hypothetical protein HNY73_002900 [Argiope bruennichi]
MEFPNTMNDDFQIEESVKVFGKLWDVLHLMGISVFPTKYQKELKKLLYLMLKYSFPFFLLCSLVYLWHSTITNEELDYASVLAMLNSFLCCLLWVMLFIRIRPLKRLLIHLSNINTNSISTTSRLSLLTNIALCLIMVYLVMSITVKLRWNRMNKIPSIEILRLIQEIVFPFTITITYISICYLLLQALRQCHNIFQKNLDLTCSLSVKNLIKNYLEILKGVEMFEDLFSGPVFILILRNFSWVSVIVIDMMSIYNWMAVLMIESFFHMTFICGVYGILSIYAANIPLEIQHVKLTLSNKASEQLLSEGTLRNNKQISFLLKRDVCVLTACNVFTFDRGFVLKAIVTVIAQAVVFEQLKSSVTERDKA